MRRARGPSSTGIDPFHPMVSPDQAGCDDPSGEDESGAKWSPMCQSSSGGQCPPDICVDAWSLASALQFKARAMPHAN